MATESFIILESILSVSDSHRSEPKGLSPVGLEKCVELVYEIPQWVSTTVVIPINGIKY